MSGYRQNALPYTFLIATSDDDDEYDSGDSGYGNNIAADTTVDIGTNLEYSELKRLESRLRTQTNDDLVSCCPVYQSHT